MERGCTCAKVFFNSVVEGSDCASSECMCVCSPAPLWVNNISDMSWGI